MRISHSTFLRGLSASDRRQVVAQAAAEQQLVIDELVSDLFRGSAAAAELTVRPLTYWSNIARENQVRPSTSPLAFWENLEAQRRSNDAIDRQAAAANLFGLKNNPAYGPWRHGFGPNLTPVELANGGKRSAAPLANPIPTLGQPSPTPIRTIRYQDLVTLRSQVTSPTGRIIDVIA